MDAGDFKYAVDCGAERDRRVVALRLLATCCRASAATSSTATAFETADGVLNGSEAVAFGEWFQDQFNNGYAPKSNCRTVPSSSREGRHPVTTALGVRRELEKFGDDLGDPPAGLRRRPEQRRRIVAVGPHLSCTRTSWRAD